MDKCKICKKEKKHGYFCDCTRCDRCGNNLDHHFAKEKYIVILCGKCKDEVV